MPNFKKRFYRLVDRVLNRPEYYRFMQENKTGYRSRVAAIQEYRLVRDMPNATTYMDITQGDIEHAIMVYGRAGRPQLEFLVLGRKINRRSKILRASEEYPMIDLRMIENFGSLNEEAPVFGSVLASESWTFYLNDMLMYGAIANRQTFYLASKREMKFLWDTDKPFPAIYTRELAALFMAGYELRRMADGSEAMVPPYGTVHFSLTKYITRLPLYLTRETVQKMTYPDLLGFEFNPQTNHIIPF